MRVYLSILGLALCLTASATAQRRVYVPHNSPTVGTCDPTVFAAGARRYVYVVKNHFAYPELGRPVKIKEIAFAPCATANFTATRMQIRMGNTTVTNAAQCFQQNHRFPIVVYDGPVRWTALMNTWSPITLQYPFVARGWENIAIEIRYQGANTTVPLHMDSSMSRVFQSTGADPFNAPCAVGSAQSTGPKTRFTLDDGNAPLLFVADHAHLGLYEPIEIMNATPGDTFQLAASRGQSPITVGGCRVNLAPDSTAYASVAIGSPYFNGYSGVIDEFGKGTGYLFIPNNRGLLGLRLFHAAVTFRNGKVAGCTNTAGVEVWR